jgi:[acyl-carrier-protein] S-malonyltransferase
MKRIFLCPGQGSQKIGMGVALRDAFPVARAVFDEVDAALSQNLSQIMAEGPEDLLTSTENAQPALMACAVAACRVIEAESGQSLPQLADYVAGHSLGEYAALTIAGAFDLTTAARLLKLRGQAMQRAVAPGEGAMAAILNLDWEQLNLICSNAAHGEVVTCANDNSTGQIVISGHKAAVERAMDLSLKAGAKRALLLPVSAPFHCSLMTPAATEMRAALDAATINAPSVPVITNVSVAPETNPDRIRDLLVAQVTGTVRWRESVLQMAELGVTEGVELGVGNVLCGLVKRTTDSITCTSVSTPDDIAAFINSSAQAA